MMNSTGKSVVAAIIIGIAVLGFIYWRVNAHPEARVTNGVIVFDNSGSTANDGQVLIALAERAMQQPRLAKGSTLTILALGDGRTGNEPRLLAKYEIPYSRRALEGKKAIARRRAQILADLQNQLDKLPRPGRSAIFLAIKRGAEQLRGGSCRADSECFLYVRTDGEETVESSIRKAIEGTSKSKGMPEPIANEGIKVAFCGFAETNAAVSTEPINARRSHTARSGDHLRDVWALLFTAPESVSFEPYCPKTETGRLAEN